MTLFFFSSCEKENLYDYNPTMTADHEKDLGNELYRIMIDNPGAFQLLERAQYPNFYNYLDAAMKMVETQTQMRDKYNWDILVRIDDNSKNTYVLPGGKIIITTGMLKFLEGEHQLLALLAHEAYYTDRKDQDDKDEQSIIMNKMKEEFGSVYGTKVFVDVINQMSSEGFDMAMFGSEVMYEPNYVIGADDLSLRVLCENYLYSPYGIMEIIEKAEEENFSEFAWFENKMPGPLVYNTLIIDSVYDRDYRIDNILNFTTDNCGEHNTNMYLSRYDSYIDMLP